MAGAPLRTASGVQIAGWHFRPGRPALIHPKVYLHADELPYFEPGDPATPSRLRGTEAALAICYELSVPRHAAAAARAGARVYVASTAKDADGVRRASKTLRARARRHAMSVVLANCVGPFDGLRGGGGSSAWDATGVRLARLGAREPGWLLVDVGEGTAATAVGAADDMASEVLSGTADEATLGAADVVSDTAGEATLAAADDPPPERAPA